jgi:alpha-D-xyloside xylohydrolase
VITGNNSDDLYAGYAKLTGTTPPAPKALRPDPVKARYETQKELPTLRRAIASASCRSM